MDSYSRYWRHDADDGTRVVLKFCAEQVIELEIY